MGLQIFFNSAIWYAFIVLACIKTNTYHKNQYTNNIKQQRKRKIQVGVENAISDSSVKFI